MICAVKYTAHEVQEEWYLCFSYMLLAYEIEPSQADKSMNSYVLPSFIQVTEQIWFVFQYLYSLMNISQYNVLCYTLWLV